MHDLIAELALRLGVKDSSAALPKIEVWRAANAKPARYLEDPDIVAIATDDPRQLPAPTTLPILDLDDAAGVVAFLLADPGRYLYRPPGQDGAASGRVPVGVARVPARALRRGGGAAIEERVAEEVPMAIEVDGIARLVVFATPTDLEASSSVSSAKASSTVPPRCWRSRARRRATAWSCAHGSGRRRRRG